MIPTRSAGSARPYRQPVFSALGSNPSQRAQYERVSRRLAQSGQLR